MTAFNNQNISVMFSKVWGTSPTEICSNNQPRRPKKKPIFKKTGIKSENDTISPLSTYNPVFEHNLS